MDTRGQKRLHAYLSTDDSTTIENDTAVYLGTVYDFLLFCTSLIIFFVVSDSQDANEPAPKEQKPNVSRLLDGKYFEIVNFIDRTKIEAKCATCNQVRKGDIRSTGNFMEHYRSKHGEKVKEVEIYRKSKQITTTSLR